MRNWSRNGLLWSVSKAVEGRSVGAEMPTIWNTANMAKTVNRNIAIGLTNFARSPST